MAPRCNSESSDAKSKLRALKIKIKQWETTFFEENGCKPSKSDISSTAPSEIKESYKEYWTLAKSEVKGNDEVWGSQFNKSDKRINNVSSNGRSLNNRNGDPLPGVVKSYVEKLRCKALLSTVPYVKLPKQTVLPLFKEPVSPEEGLIIHNAETNTKNTTDFGLHSHDTTSNFGLSSHDTKTNFGLSPHDLTTDCRLSTENITPDLSLQPQSTAGCEERSNISQSNKAVENFDKTAWKVRDATLRVRDTGLQKKKSRMTGCCSIQSESYVINSAKVDLNWLSRCSLNESGSEVKDLADLESLERKCLPVETFSETDKSEKLAIPEDKFKFVTCLNGGSQFAHNGDIQSSHETHVTSDLTGETSRNEIPTKYKASTLEEDTEGTHDHLLRKISKPGSDDDSTANAPSGSKVDDVTYEPHYNSEASESTVKLLFSENNLKKRKEQIDDSDPKPSKKLRFADATVYEFKLGSTKDCYEFQDDINLEERTTKKPKNEITVKVNKMPVLKPGSTEDCYKFQDDINLEEHTTKKLKQNCKSRQRSRQSSKDTPGTKRAKQKSSENFVKLNLKKKVFVRGKRNFSYKKFKRNKWKKYQKSKANLAEDEIECSENMVSKSHDLNDEQGFSEDPDDVLPTLHEASISSDARSKDAVLENNNEISTEPVIYRPVEPLFDLDSNGKAVSAPKLVFNNLKKLGFASFRQGQEKAVTRILSGLSTLVVLPTGSGKSLCYQLPAFMYSQTYHCITLVISPLVSLMEDQVSNVPECLNAACWHSNLTEDQKQYVLEKLASGIIKILFVSPETLVGGSGYLFGKLPPVAFVCIDEAHCISEWSHNFRPSYLQLIKVLTTKMNVRCILALTATASKATADSISSHLGLKDDAEAVIDITNIPSNLCLSVSEDEFRDEALVGLLRGERFAKCYSIIIYCTRREETERVASCIRIHMQDEEVLPPADTKRKGKKCKWLVEAYHSGLTPAKRKSVQKRFMDGNLRIVVATVAFGMGLNKADVRGIIHYNMPKTFEHYVQEIGRAGRDGQNAHCHLFLNTDGSDLPELRRHIYGNAVDRHIIRKLLSEVFKPCRCMEKEEVSTEIDCPRHEMAISIHNFVNKLDLKEESIATLLCYLEGLPEKLLEFLPPVYSTCTIRCYRGQDQLQELVRHCPPVAVAFGLARKSGKRMDNGGHLKFDVVQIASHMGWKTAAVKKQLKNLEWVHTAGKWKKTGVMVEFSDLAFHLLTKGTLSDDQKDDLLDLLYDKVISTERLELNRLKEVELAFKKVSHTSYLSCCNDVDLERSQTLKRDLMKYYEQPIADYLAGGSSCETVSCDPREVDSARRDIRSMLDIHHDTNFTGRAIARIFHGVGSPCYPVEVWGRVRRFWRCHMHVDFNLLKSIANEELRKIR